MKIQEIGQDKMIPYKVLKLEILFITTIIHTILIPQSPMILIVVGNIIFPIPRRELPVIS